MLYNPNWQKNNDTIKTLIAARAVIANPNNWIQGRRWTADSKHCVLGAIERTGLYTTSPAWEPCIAALAAALPGPVFQASNKSRTPKVADR